MKPIQGVSTQRRKETIKRHLKWKGQKGPGHSQVPSHYAYKVDKNGKEVPMKPDTSVWA